MDQVRADKFVAGVANGMEPGAAYIAAGFPGPCGRKAVEAAEMLLLDPTIQAAIVEAKNVEVAEVTKKDIMAELWHTYQEAKMVKNFPAANRALELLGKEKGMFVDRKDVRFSKSLGDMTDEELKELAANNAE